MAKKKSVSTDKKKTAGDKYEGLRAFIANEMPLARAQNENLMEERVQATKYYKGELPLTDKEDQSRYTSTDVHDVVNLIVPQLVDMFCGSETIVEFVPNHVSEVEEAAQRTDYVNHLIQSQSDWLTCVISVLKDGLIKKIGYLKCSYDNAKTAEILNYRGIDEEEYLSLVSDDTVEVIEEKTNTEKQSATDPETGEPAMEDKVVSYDITIRRTSTRKRFAIEPVPPEELWFEKGVRKLDVRCAYVAHSTLKTKAELLEMGISEEEIEENGGTAEQFGTTENIAREADNITGYVDGYRYTEHYVLYDQDGDGIAERLKVSTLGTDGANIIDVEGLGMIPIAAFTPDPEPHTVIGNCPTDYVRSTQRANTQIMRDVLDSLGYAVHQRPVVLDGEANMDDILSNDIGAPVRIYSPGALQYISPEFVGQAGVGVIQYLLDDRESKVGVSKMSTALDPKALQSSTAEAVTAVTNASQTAVKYIARIFAETTLKTLFKILNGLVLRFQSESDIVRLRGKYVPVDPREWNSDMDVAINIGAISNTKAEKASMMGVIISKQEQLLSQLGINNPFVTPQQYMNSVGKMLEIMGVRDSANYFNTSIDPSVIAKLQAPSQQGPTPEQQMVMIEQQKNIEKDKTDRLQIIMNDDRERDIAQAKLLVEVEKIKAQYHTEINTSAISTIMEQQQDRLRQNMKMQMLGQQQQHESNMSHMQHNQEIAKREHAARLQQQNQTPPDQDGQSLQPQQ